MAKPNDKVRMFVENPVTHFLQRYEWDCGIACLLMALDEEDRQHFVAHFDEICEEEGFGTTTWTIDLAYLFRKYKVPVKFCTETLGINHGFQNIRFYDDSWDQVAKRIQDRFAKADDCGIDLCEVSLSNYDLILHIAKGGLVLMLVDDNYLTCDSGHEMCHAKRVECPPLSSCFEGHYILVNGYDMQSDLFLYHNPAIEEYCCSESFSDLLEARTAFGTDQDCILIYPKESDDIY